MNGRDISATGHVQGFVLAYELRGHMLTYKFLSLIPLARIDLRDAVQIRLSSFSEYMKTFGAHPWGTRFWWTCGLRCRDSEAPVYLIRTCRKKRSCFVRLKAGMHYRLRMAIHRWSAYYTDAEGRNAVLCANDESRPQAEQLTAL